MVRCGLQLLRPSPTQVWFALIYHRKTLSARAHTHTCRCEHHHIPLASRLSLEMYPYTSLRRDPVGCWRCRIRHMKYLGDCDITLSHCDNKDTSLCQMVSPHHTIILSCPSSVAGCVDHVDITETSWASMTPRVAAGVKAVTQPRSQIMQEGTALLLGIN